MNFILQTGGKYITANNWMVFSNVSEIIKFCFRIKIEGENMFRIINWVAVCVYAIVLSVLFEKEKMFIPTILNQCSSCINKKMKNLIP